MDRFDPLCLRPCVQISAAIDDLAAQLVIGWANPPVAPLRQLLIISDNLEFWIAKNVVAIVVKEIGHLPPASNGFGDDKYSVVSLE